MVREDEQDRRPRLERKRLEVAGRIRCVCQHMTEDEFRALVRRISEIDVKYAQRRADEFDSLGPDS